MSEGVPARRIEVACHKDRVFWGHLLTGVVTIVFAGIMGAVILREEGGSRNETIGAMFGVCVGLLFGIVFTGIAVRELLSRFAVDDNGVTHTRMGRTRHIRFDEVIESDETNGKLTLRSPTNRITIPMTTCLSGLIGVVMERVPLVTENRARAYPWHASPAQQERLAQLSHDYGKGQLATRVICVLFALFWVVGLVYLLLGDAEPCRVPAIAACLFMIGLSFYMLFTTNPFSRVDEDAYTLMLPLRTRRVPFEDVAGARFTRNTLYLRTSDGKKIRVAGDALTHWLLLQRVQAVRDLTQPGLALTIRGDIWSYTMLAVAGVCLAFMAHALICVPWGVTPKAIGAVWGCCAVFALVVFLRRPRRFEFRADTIRSVSWVGSRTWQVADLDDIVDAGLPELVFKDGEVQVNLKGNFGTAFPLDYLRLRNAYADHLAKCGDVEDG